MTEAEYSAILEYLRRRMREYDLTELDNRIASAVSAYTEQRDERWPSQLLLRYLELLETAMQLDAAETGGEIAYRLQQVARTVEGGLIEGVELRLTETDRALYAIDADEVDLVALPDLPGSDQPASHPEGTPRRTAEPSGMNIDQVKAEIDTLLGRYRARKAAQVAKPSLLPDEITSGKLYEAWVLCDVLGNLQTLEGYDVVLREATKVVLKTAGGPINRSYPHFSATAAGRMSIEIWTDIFFLTLSHYRRGAPSPPRDGDFHELDVVVVPAGTWGLPRHDEVLVGVECKNVSGYEKELLRGILGVRRELSYLQDLKPTSFRRWPRSEVVADPASCLLVYSTDFDGRKVQPNG
jgi:hypothetical protein